jgi:transcription-repair coupling factor (superfamily II helicase)
VLALFDLARLRASCCALGVARLRGGPQGVAADLRPDRPLPAMAAEADVILREGRVVWKRPCPDSAGCAALAADLLERIRAARERAG